jgi:hypothetical protein
MCANITNLPVSTTRLGSDGWRDDREHRAGRQVGNVMSAEQSGFRVSDQRHFAADGTPRTDQTEAAPPAVEQPAEAEGPESTPLAAEVNFSSFILSLAAQASILLHADPSGKGDADLPARDREGAQRIIAVLEMLQDKTEGRRTAEESRMLDGLLFELRMAYVGRSQRGGR